LGAIRKTLTGPIPDDSPPGDEPAMVNAQTTTDPRREPGVHVSMYDEAPHLYPNRSSIASTANPQRQSLFFSLLPPEVRRIIYACVWSTCGYQHGIHIDMRSRPDRSNPKPVFDPLSYPCLQPIDEVFCDEALNAELDALWDEYEVMGKLQPIRIERRWGQEPGVAWGLPVKFKELGARRARSHFECYVEHLDKSKAVREVKYREGRGREEVRPTWTPFVPVLLTCKKMYGSSLQFYFFLFLVVMLR